MSLHLRSLNHLGRDLAVALVNAIAHAIDKRITAWANTTDQPTIPTQRTRQIVRTACVKEAADEWEATYPVLPEAWLQLTTQEAND